MTPAVRTERYLDLFRAALGQSARDGEALLREVFHAALRSLDAEIGQSAGQPERHLHVSRQLMDNKAAALCARFPAQLRQAFQSQQSASSKFGELALGELNHDQLEQMDEIQVLERVEMARILRLLQNSVPDPLNELDACMSALLGLDHIRPEHNPLRPKMYLKVLHELMTDADVPAHMRIIWLRHMTMPLAKALQGSYTLLVRKIRSYGVQPLSVSKTAVPDRQVSQPGAALARQRSDAGEGSARPSVLTLDRLHELLTAQSSGQPYTAPDEAETAFSGVSDPDVWGGDDEATTDFAATIPAAFEALQNMNQVDDVLARLPQLQRAAPSAGTGTAGRRESNRQKFRSHCQTSAQVLSFEVLCQMLDNLLQDPRLLEPIRLVIEDLEPALFQLVKVDVRFFNNKQHPARRLLQELTQGGLAFDSVDAPGYALFIRSLHRFVNPLSRMPVDSAEPFESALRNLKAMWSEQALVSNKRMEQAMQALGRAEERNLLAEKMVAALAQIPDMQRVNAAVAEFLCGPWAQVMAYAELSNAEGVEDPGGYKNLVNILLWSAQPELTRQHVARLNREVATLLPKLRQGLALINCPANQTSSFFDVLMKLHQQAVQPSTGLSSKQDTLSGENLPGKHKHWLAPEEAKASGFMDIPDEAPALSPAGRADQACQPMPDSVVPMAGQARPVSIAADLSQLTVGAWLEISVQGVWQRSQLSWISQQGSLYLFTNVQGGTQSMTRRMLENLLAANALRVVSEQSMVDGALDAVVHAAMLNSLDIKL